MIFIKYIYLFVAIGTRGSYIEEIRISDMAYVVSYKDYKKIFAGELHES